MSTQTRPAPHHRTVVLRIFKHTFHCSLLLSVAGMVVHGRRLRLEDEAALGKYTARDAINRARPLLAKLTDYAPGLEVSADSVSSPTGAKRRNRQWTVCCRDEAENEVARVTFDADTSKLVSASRRLPHLEQASHKIGATEAARTASAWLRNLPFEDVATEWDVAETIPSEFTWVVRLQSGDRMALVLVDRPSGRVRSVTVR